MILKRLGDVFVEKRYLLNDIFSDVDKVFLVNEMFWDKMMKNKRCVIWGVIWRGKR